MNAVKKCPLTTAVRASTLACVSDQIRVREVRAPSRRRQPPDGLKDRRGILESLLEIINNPQLWDASGYMRVSFLPGPIPTWEGMRIELLAVAGFAGLDVQAGKRTQQQWKRWIARTLQDAKADLHRLVQGGSQRLVLRGVTVTRGEGRQPRLVHMYEADERTAFRLALLGLVELVGVQRLRRCALPTCGRLFIARKRQLACSLTHAQETRYARWKAAGMPRGTRGGLRASRPIQQKPRKAGSKR